MAGEEGFLALAKEGHDEGPLGVAQAQTEELDLRLTSVQIDLGFTPVCLRLAGVVFQWDHHFPPRPLLSDVLAHRGLPSPEAELRDQACVHPAGGVALLGRPLLVFL